jgi:ABC-type multidrug transport system fused ATPase/permease subunit
MSPQSGSFVRRYVAPQGAAIALMAVVLLTSIGLALAGPQIVSHFIQVAQNGASTTALLHITILYLLVVVAHQVMTTAARYASARVGWTATNRIRGDLTAHVLRLGPEFHESRSPGELIERIDGDVNVINAFFSSFVVVLVGNALLLVGILVAVSFISPWIGVSFAALIVVVMGGLAYVQRFGAPWWEADREHNAQFYGYAGEVLHATEDLRSCGAESYAMAGVLRRLRGWLPVELRATAWGNVVWMSTIGLFTGVTLLGYGLSGWLFHAHRLSLSGVYLVVAYGLMLLDPVEQIRTQLQYLQQAAGSLTRVGAVFAISPALTDGPDELPAGPLSVELDHVTFGYRRGDSTDVLRDLSLTVPAGRVLGLVGRTGAGKTTITRLLFRTYDPHEGVVRLGGRDIRSLRLASLRSGVGLVTQDVQIFHASLRDNLTFFDEDVDDGRLLETLSALGLRDWMSRLPDGLDTAISPDSLSGGEAQLIAFTRVFLKDPGLLILDEPSSRLDGATEALLQRAMEQLLAGRTAIIIAHRLDTLSCVDDILVLDDGLALERGMATALLGDPGSLYAAYHRSGQEAL